MNTRTLIIAAASLLAACSSRIIPATVDPSALKAQREKLTAALAAQLQAINYTSSVTHEGERIDIHVGQVPVADVRKAICRQRGWPSSEGKMVRFDDTLRYLRTTGITKIQIIGDGEPQDVELSQDGRCLKPPSG